jgi:hypothetical protein
VPGDILFLRSYPMMLPVYHGQNYSYSYETGTGNYLLYDTKYRKSVYLQGEDASIFSSEIDKIDTLPEYPIKTAILIENLISNYL